MPREQRNHRPLPGRRSCGAALLCSLALVPVLVLAALHQPVQAQDQAQTEAQETGPFPRPILALGEHWPPFHAPDNPTKADNPAAEFLDRLGKELGWEFVFKRRPIETALQHLHDGEADMLVGVGKNPEREEYLDFVEPPYTTCRLASYIRADGGYTLVTVMDQLKLRTASPSSLAPVEPPFKDHEQAAYMASIRQLVSMLADGHVDAITGLDCHISRQIVKLGLEKNLRKAALAPAPGTSFPLYLAVAKSSSLAKRLDELNAATARLVQADETNAAAAQ